MTRTAFALFCLFLFVPCAFAQVPKWNVSTTQSTLTFTATQMGAVFTGHVGRFEADIRFDLARPENSRVAVDIDMTSLATGDRDRDRAAAMPEWLDLARFPAARFESGVFRKTKDGAYEGQGTLILKGISAPVTLSFAIELIADAEPLQARVKGHAALDRSVFGVGTGEWESEDVIGNKIGVDFNLVAYRQK